MASERTFIMVKPDGVQRGLIHEIIRRFEVRGFKLVAARFLRPDQDLAKKHYEEHRERPFFGELVSFITSGPVFATVWEGTGVIATARAMMGRTNPLDAAPGTIRGDLAVSLAMNVVHGSDSPESAAREIALWFNPDDLLEFERAADRFI